MTLLRCRTLNCDKFVDLFETEVVSMHYCGLPKQLLGLLWHVVCQCTFLAKLLNQPARVSCYNVYALVSLGCILWYLQTPSSILENIWNYWEVPYSSMQAFSQFHRNKYQLGFSLVNCVLSWMLNLRGFNWTECAWPYKPVLPGGATCIWSWISSA